MNTNNTNKPELLAPAGNLDCALAALQSGADAVYAGISRFNAREMGENFSWDDMSRLSAYTKKINRRFYLTLNTILKEHELEEFGESVERISALQPDAVIIQDLGVLRFLREYFPALEIHASTQMGIHNSAGVITAGELGIRRVILERQTTIEELRKICRSPVDIEVFIHGALCCSISGHCLFSSWLGGWSGNRGRCKQPCRRRFHGEEHGTKKSGFFFSPRDQYSLDMLDVLEDAGVRSLKIEGRLKKPDYVKSVVTAYRMMLDAPTGEKQSVIGEARSVLAGSYGRKWSHGFSTAEDMEELIQYKSAGVSGRLIGSVEKTSQNGFEALLTQRLHIGDRIRIQPKSGDEGPSITVTRMSRDRETIKTALKDSRVFIHCDKEVGVRSMIYKIGESSAESVKRPSDLQLFEPAVKIKLKITASPAGLSVEAHLPDGTAVSWHDDTPIEAAQNRPLSGEDLSEAFSVTRNSILSAAVTDTRIENNIDGTGLFIPAGRLKKTRREFWEWLEAQDVLTEALTSRSQVNSGWRSAFTAERGSFKRTSPGSTSVFKYDNSNLPETGGSKAITRCCDIGSFLGMPAGAAPSPSVPGADDITELILPFFCPEDRLDALRKAIRQSADRGIRRFRITSLYQFRLLREALSGSLEGPGSIPEDFHITVSFPLPAANSMAAMELKGLGADRVQIWLELDSKAAEDAAAHWPAEAEIYRKGKPFLLATRAALSIDGGISDSRGKQFIVEKPLAKDLDFTDGAQIGALGFVFPSEVLEHPPINGCSDYYDLVRVSGTEEITGFNYEYSLI